MDLAVCPHCDSQGIAAARVPRGVIVVMPCPACSELVVLFRKKVVALSREILEHGTRDEKTSHLANVIAEFLDSSVFGLGFKGIGMEGLKEAEEEGLLEALDPSEFGKDKLALPISAKDVEQFIDLDLARLDDPEYFRKHFG